ncbi:MAG: hypothetical protein H6729_03070 [Deltaproteobacteria bacterium]|nr:hypothetical protein [Deltaproteobacteria bacterium]
MAFGIWLIVLGALAVPSLILSKKPNLKELLGKISPYQGYIGAISTFWGAYGLIVAALNFGLLSAAPIWWVTMTATAFVTFSLGILLGINTLKRFIKQPQAQAKMDATVAKLAPYQGTLGLAGLGLGAWCVVASFVLTVA